MQDDKSFLIFFFSHGETVLKKKTANKISHSTETMKTTLAIRDSPPIQNRGIYLAELTLTLPSAEQKRVSGEGGETGRVTPLTVPPPLTSAFLL